MSKMSELSMLIDNLISCGETLTETAKALRAYYSDTGEEKPAVQEKPKKEEPAPTYSKEAVRGILAKKANEANGQYKAEVKAIVKKYGNGGSLTDVDAKDYAALVAEVEGIGNA